MKLIVQKEFTYHNKFYSKLDEIDSKEIKFEDIVKMNEKGFIEPLTTQELMLLKKDSEIVKNKNKKEEE